MEPYIGKFCNKCGWTLYENDEVIICPVCRKPHHVSCWLEEGGCATKGCSEQNPEKRLQEDTETQKAEQSPEVKKEYAQAQKTQKNPTWGTIVAVVVAFILGIGVGHYWAGDTSGSTSQKTKSTQSSYYSSSTWTAPAKRTPSESEIKSAAIAAAKKALASKKGSSWTGKIDPETSYYHVSKIEKTTSGYKVFGTVSLKDSYGNYVRKYGDGSGGLSADWTVTVDENGKAGLANMS